MADKPYDIEYNIDGPGPVGVTIRFRKSQTESRYTGAAPVDIAVAMDFDTFRQFWHDCGETLNSIDIEGNVDS